MNRDFINSILAKLKFSNLSGFQTRQKLLLVFVVFAAVFLLFYWTAMAINSQKAKAASYAADTQLRLADVQRFVSMQQSGSEIRKLNAGLFSHIQSIKERYGLNGDIVNIRLVSPAGAANRQEQASFRAENLVYQEFTAILNDLEQYDNIWVKTVTISKRFDNTKKIDVAFDVIRGEP